MFKFYSEVGLFLVHKLNDFCKKQISDGGEIFV